MLLNYSFVLFKRKNKLLIVHAFISIISCLSNTSPIHMVIV